RIAPLVGSSRPAIILSSVVLPQPDGPSRHTKLPFGTFSVTSSTAVNVPKVLVTPSRERPDIADGSDCMGRAPSPPCTRGEGGAAASAGDHLGPFLVQPVGLAGVEVVARNDRVDFRRHGSELFRGQ